MKQLIASVLMIGTMVFGAAGFAQPAYAAAGPGCPDSIFAIPTWYKGLQGANCEITTPARDKDGKALRAFIAKIVLNVIQALLVIVAYVTVFFIMKGGFNYMTSTGSPDGMQKAKKTITNAVIGLVIASLAASIVNAIGGAIK